MESLNGSNIYAQIKKTGLLHCRIQYCRGGRFDRFRPHRQQYRFDRIWIRQRCGVAIRHGFDLRLRKHWKISAEKEEEIERKATKFVAFTFFILGFYVLFESLRKLIENEIPNPSLAGMIIAVISLFVMPILAWQKLHVGKQIKSQALIADSKETLACFFLSVALLLGLGSNYVFGFWQADPIVGLIIVAFLFREGREAWLEN